jgi:hypothetical protein
MSLNAWQRRTVEDVRRFLQNAGIEP